MSKDNQRTYKENLKIRSVVKHRTYSKKPRILKFYDYKSIFYLLSTRQGPVLMCVFIFPS